jgi:hypothetical protein
MGFHMTVSLVGSPRGEEALPVLDSFEEPWVFVNGEIPLWLNRDGPRTVPWRSGPFSILMFVPENGKITNDPGLGPAVGTARLLFHSVGEDSVQVTGYINLSGALIPDDADKGKPADWLKGRLNAVLDGWSVTEIIPETIGHLQSSYRFEGGLRFDERADIDSHLEGIFGAAWIPPRSARHTTMPRVPIPVPEPVDLTLTVRIEASSEWTVLYPRSLVMMEDQVGRLAIEPDFKDDSVTVRRSLKLHPGWLDRSGVESLRSLLAMEGQSATRLVVLRP